jgi:hypothetical protein
VISNDAHPCEYILPSHKLFLEVGIELTGEAFPDYVMQFNEDLPVDILHANDLERWRIVDMA